MYGRVINHSWFKSFLNNWFCCRQVIEGTQTLKKMEEQETMNERPTKDVKITDCGVLQFQFWERGSLPVPLKGRGGYQQKPCELLMLWKIKSWTFWILWERFCLRHLGNNAYLYCMKDVIIIFCELSLEIRTICSDFLILFTNENHKRGPNILISWNLI